jgi:hypothetical protein
MHSVVKQGVPHIYSLNGVLWVVVVFMNDWFQSGQLLMTGGI